MSPLLRNCAMAQRFLSSKSSTDHSVVYKVNYERPTVWKATVEKQAGEFQSYYQYRGLWNCR